MNQPPARAGTSASDSPPRPVEVGCFVDCRPSGGAANPPGPGTTAGRGAVVPIKISVVTRAFLIALRHAGYHADTRRVPGGFDGRVRRGPLYLEGRVWAFDIHTRPSSMLDVDVSLKLYDLNRSALLWQAEFPGDSAVPAWVGPGCSLEASLPLALREVEQAAVMLFRSAPFALALGRPRSPAQKAVDTHVVVPAASWTATDEGEIRATAHESVDPTAPPGKVADGPEIDKDVSVARKSKKRREAGVAV